VDQTFKTILKFVFDTVMALGLVSVLLLVFVWDSFHVKPAAPPQPLHIVFLLNDHREMPPEAAQGMKANSLAQARSFVQKGQTVHFTVIPFGDGQQIAPVADAGKISGLESGLHAEPAGAHDSNTLAGALKQALADVPAKDADVRFFIVSTMPVKNADALAGAARKINQRNIRAVVQADAKQQSIFRPLYKKAGRFIDFQGEDRTEPELLAARKNDEPATPPVRSLLASASTPEAKKQPEERIVARSLYTAFKGKSKIDTAEKDEFGNARGSKYDLGKDGAFEGLQIAVLQLYRFNFSAPEAALKVKGFSIVRWQNQPPSPEELKRVLDESCQLWVISDERQKLNDKHIAVIKEFFDSGHGVYLWGDNVPYYVDANRVGRALINAEMNGDVRGNRTVGIRQNNRGAGVVPDHLISTGVETVYEGSSIATVQGDSISPLIYGSAGNLVVGVYEREERRLIIDGGFTRLYYKWDTAGTGRYVKNAAAWLVNYERFGDHLFEVNDRNAR